MFKKGITLSALLVSSIFSVSAEDLSGFYLSGKVGVSLQQQADRDLKSSGTDLINGYATHSQLNFSSDTKSLLSGGIAGGYDLNSRFNLPIRIELEYIARDNGSQSLNESHLDFALLVPNYGDNELFYTSRIRTQTLMLNVYWDVNTATGFRPYFTAGMGMANNRLRHQTKYRVINNRNSINMSGNKTQLAWSLGAGLICHIDENWSVDLGYRYIDAGKASADTSWRSTAFNLDAIMDAEVNTRVRYHDIHAGISYWF
ncbi:outer membrane protein [Intestinirhabdus alba]|nr:outer membrane beta-barrel protein [Intestinirhabdus alba]